ncbi:hypothetical protein LTR66_014119 [Elasticomyces elasticus]|nr:hypothetical protein LTR66_014119 [Elasticomyces elasticus]
MVAPQVLSQCLRVFLKLVALCIFKCAKAHEQVVDARVAIVLASQVLAMAVTTLNDASVEFLKALNQRFLLLLKNLDISATQNLQFKNTFRRWYDVKLTLSDTLYVATFALWMG